jgi:hypothetical protein
MGKCEIGEFFTNTNMDSNVVNQQNTISYMQLITLGKHSKNKFCIGVFFYFKKAFDVCSHSILLMKLERMGVRGLPWIGSGATWITALSL